MSLLRRLRPEKLKKAKGDEKHTRSASTSSAEGLYQNEPGPSAVSISATSPVSQPREFTIETRPVDDTERAQTGSQSNVQLLPQSQPRIETLSAVSSGRDSYTTGDTTTNVHNVNYNYHYSERRSEDISEISQSTPDLVLKWLGAPNYEGLYEIALSQRIPVKTGAWFVESPNFTQYVEGNGAVLWAGGPLGSGKTVIAGTAVKALKDKFKTSHDVAICFAFLRYDNPHSALDVLLAFLAQMVASHERACALVRPFYDAMVPTEREGVERPANPDIANLLQRVVDSFSKVFVVIDGFDEATSNAVKDDLLESLVPLGVNLLIFCRDSELEMFTDQTPGAIQARIEAIPEDVAAHVAQQIKKTARLRTVFRGRPDSLRQIQDRVQEKSQGIFLVARLYMESMLKNNACDNLNSIFQALDDSAVGVEEMHHATLKRIDDQPESDVNTVHRVFLWILFSRQLCLSASDAARNMDIACEFPTTDDVLHEVAVSRKKGPINKNDVSPLELVLSLCRGFVVEEDARSGKGISRKRLRFVHEGTQKYVQQLTLDGLSNPHTKLAMSCAIHLNSHFEGLRDLHGQEGVSDIDLLRYRRSHPFLAYAEYNLAYHAEIARLEEPLHPFVQTVLSQQDSNTFYPFVPHKFNTSLNNSAHRGSRLGLHMSYSSVVRIPGQWKSNPPHRPNQTSNPTQTDNLDVALVPQSSTTPPAASPGLRKPRPGLPLSKHDRPPCTMLYLSGRCKYGDLECNWGHDWDLEDAHYLEIAEKAKETPCNSVRNGTVCPFGDECIYGHSCSKGKNCSYLKRGICNFRSSLHTD